MDDKGELFEKLDNCETGDVCNESSRYFCNMHTDVVIYISKGEVFPRCNQKNMPHNTNWNIIIENIKKVKR